MAGRSIKSIAKILTPPTISSSGIVDSSTKEVQGTPYSGTNNNEDIILERKIALATEGLLRISFVN
jgi:hypothetical protein